MKTRVALMISVIMAVFSLLTLSGRGEDSRNPGDLNESFGGGRVITPFEGGRLSHISIIRLLPDGSLIAAGTVSGDQGNPKLGIMRFKSDGNPDPVLNGSGKIITDFEFVPQLRQGVPIAIDNEGRVIAGDKVTLNGKKQILLMRFAATGGIDRDFGGGGGFVTTHFDESVDLSMGSIAIDGNGKIIAGGKIQLANGKTKIVLARYGTNGEPDNGFGQGGKLISEDLENGQSETLLKLAIDNNNRIVVAGMVPVNNKNKLLLARYKGDTGRLDETLNGRGTVIIDLPLNFFNDLTIDGNGKILLLASFAPGKNEEGELATFWFRFSDAGLLEGSDNGTERVLVNPKEDSRIYLPLITMTIYNGNKILVGGTSLNQDEESSFFIIRYNADRSLDTDFGENGIVSASFDAGGGSRITSLATDKDQKIFAGGSYTSGQNQPTQFALASYFGEEQKAEVVALEEPLVDGIDGIEGENIPKKSSGCALIR